MRSTGQSIGPQNKWKDFWRT